MLSFVVVFLMLSAVGSYRAYEFTDSVQFCGELCHTVMHPEFTAYQQSPHARVACVECHVGSGASWYVKSKMSGLRQVYAATFNTFPRPIPSPVQNLRPAAQTCEQCHWPKKFWGAQLKTINHFGYDEKNTVRTINLLVKTGGGDANNGMATGIHWHMNIANKISYISDEKRQNIPYISAVNLKGEVTEYFTKDNPPTAEQIAKAAKRSMDCVDCHNRPSHIYTPPDRSVDNALAAGRIDVALPYVKQQAVTVLTKEYKGTDEAVKTIGVEFPKYYASAYPQTSPREGKADQGRDRGAAAYLFDDDFPGDEARLEDASEQHRALLLQRLLPLPRWQPREQGRKSHQQRLHHLPHGIVARRRRRADGRIRTGRALQTSGGYRRSDPGELLRLPHRGGTVIAACDGLTYGTLVSGSLLFWLRL